MQPGHLPHRAVGPADQRDRLPVSRHRPEPAQAHPAPARSHQRIPRPDRTHPRTQAAVETRPRPFSVCTGCTGHAQPAPGCAAWCPAATALLALPGLMVTAVTQAGDGWTVVDMVTAPERAEALRRCPGLRGAGGGQGDRHHHAAGCVSGGPADPAALAQEALGMSEPGLRAEDLHRVAARRPAQGKANLAAAKTNHPDRVTPTHQPWRDAQSVSKEGSQAAAPS